MLSSNLDILIIFYCIGTIFLAQSVPRSQLGQEKSIELSRINIKIEPLSKLYTLIICGILKVSYLLLW